MRLTTKRLILRQVTKKDISDIVENIDDLNVSKWLLVVPYPYKQKDAIVWINHQKKEAEDKPRTGYQFGIELKSEKNIIGGCGLKKVDRVQGTAEVGYWLGQKYWKQGYGSEALEALLDLAFKKLKLRRIEAHVFKGNPSSGKLLEKYNFKLEGMKRKAVKSKANGKIYDSYIYGLLREDYRPRKR